MRSLGVPRAAAALPAAALPSQAGRAATRASSRVCQIARPARDLNHPPPVRGDRKSTRLNSSHMSISYAVFCLKKKKASAATPSPDWSTPVGGVLVSCPAPIYTAPEKLGCPELSPYWSVVSDQESRRWTPSTAQKFCRWEALPDWPGAVNQVGPQNSRYKRRLCWTAPPL